MAHEKTEDEVKEVVDTSSSAEERGRPTSCLLPARSLRSTTAIPAAEAQSSQGNYDRGIRSLSFSKLLSFRLPPSLGYTGRHGADESNSSILTGEKTEEEEDKLKQICRSQSVPTSVRRFINAKAGGSRRVGPAATGFRVVIVTDDPTQGNKEAAAEDIAAEEAVCRICMVALEGGELLKLECSCKGELALAHRGCAIKWFSIKGNGACDVCGQEVLNLPVTLRTSQATEQQQPEEEEEEEEVATAGRRYRAWHGTPILVIISMLAYFCFLEQLLVGDHGTAALAISLPFACVLGLFSSLTTTKMVSRRYVWIYSAVQFLFIVLFTNLFYRYVRMQAVIAIILSTFAGFSVAICANSVLLHILRWRAMRVNEDQQESREPPPMVDLEIAQPPP